MHQIEMDQWLITSILQLIRQDRENPKPVTRISIQKLVHFLMALDLYPDPFETLFLQDTQ
jgi:hypothetical protein